MELTIEQTLEQGIAAHKEGKLQEAMHLYRDILLSQPQHPDANHNLGVIAISTDEAHAALRLFITAVQSNPKVELYWQSFIKALIKLNMVDEAKEAVQRCEESGHKSDEIDRLKHQLEPGYFKQSVVSAVEQFYQDIIQKVVSDAAVGWFFADSFDRQFMSTNPLGEMPKKVERTLPSKSPVSSDEQHVSQLNATQVLEKLNSETSVSEKYDYLKKLISSDDANIVDDSFKEKGKADLGSAIEETFDRETVNLVIVGGGACGLFLAHSIKSRFGSRANVLVLDNRSKHANTREAFKRDWLTHIPANLFKTDKSTNLQPLLECFGTNGLIGIPINILETILQLSCKDQGVKFLFSDSFDYAQLSNDLVDLVFDATGGRLKECSYATSVSDEFALNIPKDFINLQYAGVKQLHNIPGVAADSFDVVLKPSGDFHKPHIGDAEICVHMVKVTGVPINLVPTLLAAVKELNASNMFYVWRGALKHEINEGLVLINLLDKESAFLTSVIDEPISLKALLTNSSDLSSDLNTSIHRILQLLLELDVEGQVKIEKPFKYNPYLNISPGLGSLSGKRVFAVGDSIFCGHPKMGNGLGNHLPLMNALLEKMTQH